MAIGDVVGRGFAAASVMGEIRNALRAYALEGLQPANVLDRLNRLVGHCAPEEMATIVYASFDPTTASRGPPQAARAASRRSASTSSVPAPHGRIGWTMSHC